MQFAATRCVQIMGKVEFIQTIVLKGMIPPSELFSVFLSHLNGFIVRRNPLSTIFQWENKSLTEFLFLKKQNLEPNHKYGRICTCL